MKGIANKYCSGVINQALLKYWYKENWKGIEPKGQVIQMSR